jgi:hypothetical protein
MITDGLALPRGMNLGENSFRNCDSAYVFEQVRRILQSGERRSLWRRIESELRGGGVGAVETYLRSSFKEFAQQVIDSATRFQESMK